MNQDALSLTGLRLGIFSQILLILQEFDEASQTYDTRQEDIYNIFLEASRLEAQVTETSGNPVTSAAVFAHVAALLLQYRRIDVDIPMAEISGLLAHLQSTYRPLTNVTFPNVVSQTSISYDGGTDLKTRIDGLDMRLTEDEGELHSMAVALAGTDFMQSETATQSWLQTHVRDYVLDSVLKNSKLHQVFETANEWTISWGMMSHYLVSLTSTNRGYIPDQTWAGYSTREICNRFVYKRFRFSPSGLWTPLNPVPSGDFYPTDMNCVHYNDIEVRGDSSFLCGKAGSAQEGKFRFKAVTAYLPDASSSYPDDPLAIHATSDLLIMDPTSATFHVHVNAPSLSINGIAVDPVASQTTNNTYHNYTNDHHFTQNITRKHLHAHHNVSSDQHFFYQAPHRTVVNRNTQHVIQTFHDQTVRQTVNRTIKSTRVVPSQLFTEFNHYQQRRTVGWDSVLNKPDFAALYASASHHHDSHYAAANHNHDSAYANANHNHDAAYAAANHNHDAAYAAADHNHDSEYYTQAGVDILLGQRASQVWVEQQLGLKQDAGDYATNTALATKADVTALAAKADASAVYAKAETYSQTEVNGMVGDKITLHGLMFTLRPHLYKSDVYNNGVRVNWVNNSGANANMILVKLSTFQDLETRVAMLEQQVGTLFDQQATADTALNAVEGTQTTIWNFTQNALQRLTAIGA